VKIPLLHPFTHWRFRRRINGGVSAGTSREAVLKKLGEPQRVHWDEGNDIWVYEVGRTRKIAFTYEVSFEGDNVRTSWWHEHVVSDAKSTEVVSCATYPLLSEVHETVSGCELLLSDGRRVMVDLSPAVLENYLTGLGYPPLEELCRAGRVRIIYHQVRMSSEVWTDIQDILRLNAEAARELRNHPLLEKHLTLPLADVVRLPFRLYGGINPANLELRADLYLSPPVDFDPDVNRAGSWYYGLLSAPGGWVFKTAVDLSSGEVQIEPENLHGHFVEGRV
jgi:hypothetical protein